MSERRRSIGRLIALQERREQLATARLAGAEAEKAAILLKREAVLTFLDGASLSGAMAVLAMRRMRDLAAQEAVAEARRAAMSKQRQDAGVRVKLARRIGEPVVRQERESAERRALEQLIEAAVSRDAAQL